MPAHSRSNGKARNSQNNWGRVTILQWSKRFDATLGLMVLSPPLDYSEELPTRRAIA
jgi:hypothetical protein